MIYEIATLRIDPNKSEEFESAIEHASAIFREAVGCQSMHLEKVIEDPSEYHIVIKWNTLENHTRDFRESEGFKKWREIVMPFLQSTPNVQHSTVTENYF